MVRDEVLKEYMFNLLLANDFEVKEIINFGKTDKENEYSLSCTTYDENNDLTCWFKAREEGCKIKISNIIVL